jgi:hypothetical protein
MFNPGGPARFGRQLSPATTIETVRAPAGDGVNAIAERTAANRQSRQIMETQRRFMTASLGDENWSGCEIAKRYVTPQTQQSQSTLEP